MKFAWSYLFVLIWIAYLIAAGVFLFSRGFLLSRVSKQDISSCRRLSIDPDDEYFLNDDIVEEIFKDVNASSNLCLPRKSKVIILVIDALKYDFGVYKHDATDPLPYENKLSVFDELLTNEPAHSRLMKFRADPPTTTLQRLKGLTTGSLPTFIDIGSNFASPAINEDNIIDQVIKSGLSTVFMGDSTWTDLYPKRFKRKYSYPSFDIFDLDTVDSEIQKHLPNELGKKDWELLIAHFLGVDHCGHRYGPLHQEMSRKLTEMDNVIRNVINQMDDDTTLLVMGDHGMTISGDHGGESEDEVNALLFAYSKSHHFITSEFGSDNITMQQIDLVPTLAAILGTPIPYSNLGLINFNIVPNVAVPHMTKYQALLLHAWQNAKQIYTYFYSYASENKRTFNVEEMDHFETKFIMLTHRVNSIYNEEAFKSFIVDLNDHLRSVLNLCRTVWVKFDANQMSQGLLMTFLPIFFAFLLINNSKAWKFEHIFTSKVVSYIYLLVLAAGVFGYRFYGDFSLKSQEHGVIFFTTMLSAGILAFLTLQNWTDIAVNWSEQKRMQNLTTRLIFVISVAVFFSNSYIIHEGKILSYLLMAIILVLLYEIFENTAKNTQRVKVATFLKSIAFKLILAGVFAVILLRYSYNLFRCREEQGNCVDFNANPGKSSVKAAAQAVVALVFYTFLTRLYLRSCGNLTGNSVNVLLARYGPALAAICAGWHMLLANSPIKNVKPSNVDALALVIYALFLIQVIVLFVSPLMVYVLPPRSNGTITISRYANVIPEIYKKMRNKYDEGNDSEDRNAIPIVYGLATLYSSILITFGVFLAVLLSVLLEPKASIGLIICILVAAVLLVVHSVLRFRTSSNFETCIQPSFTAIIGWFLVSHFCFFATSHQSTLSQIDWRAAFVGRSSNFDHSNFISALLVLLNTFCGQVFFMSLFGLLSSETFSLFALFPSLQKKSLKEKKSETNSDFRATTINKSADSNSDPVDFDVTRGELVFYENESVYLGTVFKLATQFFMLHGLRVFCSMIACTIHCRHLMVWKIFAPRFIYEGLSTFIAMPSIIFGYLVILRIHWALDRLIQKINKPKSL